MSIKWATKKLNEKIEDAVMGRVPLHQWDRWRFVVHNLISLGEADMLYEPFFGHSIIKRSVNNYHAYLWLFNYNIDFTSYIFRERSHTIPNSVIASSTHKLVFYNTQLYLSKYRLPDILPILLKNCLYNYSGTINGGTRAQWAEVTIRTLQRTIQQAQQKKIPLKYKILQSKVTYLRGYYPNGSPGHFLRYIKKQERMLYDI